MKWRVEGGPLVWKPSDFGGDIFFFWGVILVEIQEIPTPMSF